MRQAELGKEQKMSVPRWSAVEAYHMAGYAQRRFRGPDELDEARRRCLHAWGRRVSSACGTTARVRRRTMRRTDSSSARSARTETRTRAPRCAFAPSRALPRGPPTSRPPLPLPRPGCLAT